MGMLSNITSTEEGKIVLSIIWGLGLSALFRRACKGRNCIIIKGPNHKEMNGKMHPIKILED